MGDDPAALCCRHLLTDDTWSQEEHEDSPLTSDSDLSALLRGSVKCRKPPSTKQTRKEAFDRYMNIIYGLPLHHKFDFEDDLDQNRFLFHPGPNDNQPCDPPPPPPPPPPPRPPPPPPPPLKEEDTLPKSTPSLIPLKVDEKKIQSSPVLPPPRVKKAPVQKRKPKKKVKFQPPPVESAVPKNKEPPQILPPIEQPKSQTPTPPPPPSPHPSTPPPQSPGPRTPTPPPPRDPTPEVPSFLQQFKDTSWFRELFPDPTRLPGSLSDLSLHLLDSLSTCSPASKQKMVVLALQTLHQQNLLQNPDKLYRGLMDSLPVFAKPCMSPLERKVLEDTLNLLMHLKPAGSALMKRLLTLLAFKKLSLGEMLLDMLATLGVNQAERWLWPELESWDRELSKDHTNVWRSLSDRADWWLHLWTSKFKEHNRSLHRPAKWKPSSFSAVDVLNYFCSVQEEEERYVAPAGHKDTVLLPPYECGSLPIFRLGETHSMSRIRRPPGMTLPPLRNRPFLSHFPRFISLPIARVTLRPFHVYSDDDWLKASQRRYFIQQQSCVEYYK